MNRIFLIGFAGLTACGEASIEAATRDDAEEAVLDIDAIAAP